MRVALLSPTGRTADAVLPSLGLLAHEVVPAPAGSAGIAAARSAEVVLIDAAGDLARGRALCHAVRAAGAEPGIVVVLPEGGLAAVQPDWGVADVVLPTAGAAELEARLRLVAGRSAGVPATALRVGELVVDPTSFQVRVRGRLLDLTFREFELLRFLAARPGRVATRSQLLLEVWGYDYFGGERTVDVHVRRLRAKLGAEHESMIATVRGVGYKLVPAEQARAEREEAAGRSFDTPSALVARSRSLPPVGR